MASADTAYRSKKNEEAMASRGFRSEVHRKKPVGKGATANAIKRIERSNNRKSKVRAQIEHVFAVQKQKMGLVVPHYRHRPGQAQHRHGQYRLQYESHFILLEGRSVPA